MAKVSVIIPAPNELIGTVYLITNKTNGKRYVGQTIQTLRARWLAHISESKRGTTVMNNALHSYGSENFTVQQIASVISEDPLPLLNDLEIAFISSLKTRCPHGYNLASGGKNATAHPETRRKLSESHKGQIPSPETIAAVRAANTGLVRSPETRARMRAASVGRNVGRKHSPEEIARRAASLKGRIFSEEHKARIGAANRGRSPSSETRERISKSLTGRPSTMSEAARSRARERLIGNNYGLGKVAHNKGQPMLPHVQAALLRANVGRELSLDHKEKLRLTSTGRSHTSEARAKVSAARKGTPLSVEHRAKLSAAKQGKRLSAETRARMSAAHRRRLNGQG